MAKVTIDNGSNDQVFAEEESGGGIQIMEILWLVLRNLHWLVLCAAIGGLYSYYKVRGEQRLYSSGASIMIKTNADVGTDSDRASSLVNQLTGSVTISSINNEIMILKSRTLMERVVRDLGINQNYSSISKMAHRRNDLYKTTPVLLDLLDAGDAMSIVLKIKPINDSEVEISGFADGQQLVVKTGDTVISPVGRIVATFTQFYNSGYNDQVIDFRRSSVASVANGYRGRVNVTRDDPKNTILRLSLTDTSPMRAADILNTLITVYNDDAVADQERILDYSYEFINERIANLGGDLDSIHQQVASFKRSNNLISLGNYGQSYVAASAEESSKLAQLTNQREYLRSIVTFIEEIDESSMIPVGNVDGEASGLITQYNNNVIRLEKYDENDRNNPAVTKLLDQQEILKNSILSSIAIRLSMLDDKIDVARRNKNLAEAQVRAVPERQIEISSVEQMRGIKEQLYLTLLTKREELLLNKPKLESMAKVVDVASPNFGPIAPNEKQRTTRGILIGLAIPLAFILLSKFLDSRIHSRRDVEKGTKAPYLGDIPLKKDLEQHTVVVKDFSRDPVSEAFRLVRSNMEYMKNKDSKSQVVLFTSFFVSSGKTFVSTNLASSFALGGKRCVFVDLDIRKGTATKVFGVKNRMGVSNYLSGKTDDFNDIIWANEHVPGLDVIFSGPVPPNPAELLMSDRLDTLIEYLKQHYEYIFLDCVPLGLVADVDIVKRLADLTVFVLRAEKINKNMLPELDKIYKGEKLPNLAIVLNGVKHKKRRGYGYGGYGYGYGGYGYGGYGYGYGGYGYGYGYGNETENENKKKKFRLRKKHKKDRTSNDV